MNLNDICLIVLRPGANVIKQSQVSYNYLQAWASPGLCKIATTLSIAILRKNGN